MRIKIIKFIPVILFLFSANFACAAGYDFFVNAGSAESQENGTESFPFKTIGAALAHIANEKLKNKIIFIKKGTYTESIELTNGTDLVGEDRHETTISADGQKYGIQFHSTASYIRNLTIENAFVNLKIDKNSKATVINCSVKNASSNGIEVDKSNHSDKRKFTFRDSSVRDSLKRGIYVSRRKIEISGCDIEENREEGIDIHTNVRGKISGSNVKNNGESGIEMMIAGAKTTIKGNTISGNDAQGLTIQFYDSRTGKITVSKNNITDNDDYGIRYARYDHGKLKVKYQDFIKKCVKKSGNTISGNGDGDYGYQ